MKQTSSGVRKGEGPAVESDAPSARPTVRPPFDPAMFARDAESAFSTGEIPNSAAATVRAPPLARSAVSGIVPAGPALEEAAISNPRDALGGDAVPIAIASREEFGWFDLPPKASRLLAQLNGVSSLDTVCARANVTPEDGAEILLDLVEQGLVSFH
jgi:hypothetical protein